MEWPELTPNTLIAFAFALFIVSSMSALYAAPLHIGSSVDEPSSNVADTGGGPPDGATPAALTANRSSERACGNTSTPQIAPGSRHPFSILNNSSTNLRHRDGGTLSGHQATDAGVPNGTVSTQRATLTGICELADLYAPPEWVSEVGPSTSSVRYATPTAVDVTGVDAYAAKAPLARAHLTLATDLTGILTDESRSRRTATFDATHRALAARQQLVEAGHLNASDPSGLAAERTNLRGAQALLSASETDAGGQSGRLSSARRLSEIGAKLQSAQLAGAGHPVDPTGVPLPDTATPDHDTPSAAAFAILEAHGVEATPEQASTIRALDGLPDPTRRELTDVLDAYLGYYRTTRATNAADVQAIRAAQLELMAASADLQQSVDTGDESGLTGSSATVPAAEPLRIRGAIAIDIGRTDDTYEHDYHLQIDAGGDDTYTNNAGGAKVRGNATDAAALIDFGGSDAYYGRNGGGWFNRTKGSNAARKQKGGAAGFLLDAGTGDDTYESRTSGVYLKDTWKGLRQREFPEGSLGTNGGGRRAIGFLVDVGGSDTYDGGAAGTNGGGSARGVGFLLDAGTGSDTYDVEGGGSNGGGSSGFGFLFDAGGDDTYSGGSNGGAGGNIDTHSNPLPYLPYVEQIPGVTGPTPKPPHSSGFLVDAGGSDSYYGRNGGTGRQGRGFLLDAGTGDDVYDGTNGGAFRRGAVGLLVDLGGNDAYRAGNRGSNGGGVSSGMGFLVDGGSSADTYDAGKEATNGGGHSRGHGFLLDGGGSDTYVAGRVGTNGGARGRGATGVLVDVGGDDEYTAKEAGVNGGAGSGIGLLYDNAGTDFYTERGRQCRDCSDIPKGFVGAQIDGGGGEPQEGARSGPTEVLVVDDTSGTGDADCSGAGYEAIQPAVNAAEYGDTVRVCAGTYPGNVTITTSNVTLRAASDEQVVLDGEDTRRFGVALVGGDTAVEGFTALNFTVAFIAKGPGSTVADTTVSESRTGILATGLFTDSPLQETPVDSEEHESVIRDNTVTDATFGIKVHRTGNVKVTGNTIRATRYGIPLRGAKEVTIHDNTVTASSLSAGIPQRGISSLLSSEITITNNVVTDFTAFGNRTRVARPPIGSGYGIEILIPAGVGEDTTHTLRNNVMADNMYNLQVYAFYRGAYQYMDIDTSNTVNGKPVVYLVGAVNVTIGPGGGPTDNPGTGQLGAADTAATDPSGTRQVLEDIDNPGYVACVQCIDVTVRNLELAHNGQGVLIAKSKAVRVQNVRVHDTWKGIAVKGSPTDVTVTDNTIRESYIAVHVRHNCGERREFRLEDSIDSLTRGNLEVCANPSVVIEANDIQQTGFLIDRGQIRTYPGAGFGLNGLTGTGGAITVTGTGVTVRDNHISEALGAGVSMRVRKPYVGKNGLLGTGIGVSPDTVVESSVVNNTISDTYIGVTVAGSRGTTIAGNSISNVRIGFFNIFNQGLTYRDNTVTNATFGMVIHWADTNIKARNNSFRKVRWGLHVLFTWYATPPRAQSTHDFGTSNTVNGERIIWLTGATHRTIDAEDANMVVCVRCVDVTVRDMTLTDNSHGVVFWDSTNSTVANVTITDTLNTGVLIRAGQNNVVRDSTIVDSAVPIFAEPIEGRREQKNQREIVGPVRIVNNRIAVDDATWPGPVQQQGYQHPVAMWQEPMAWGHMGIWLFNPTVATVTGNTVTDNRWGVVQTISVGDAFEACVGPGRCDPPARGYDLHIANNTVRHPEAELGLNRFGPGMVGPFGKTFGIKVNSEQGEVPDASVRIRSNNLTAPSLDHGGTSGYTGIKVASSDVPSIVVEDNRVRGYQRSVLVNARGENTTSISILGNSLVGATKASVRLTGGTPGETVEIHQNLLQPRGVAGLAGYGVKYGTVMRGAGGHMGSGGGAGHVMDQQPVDATCNRWGNHTGPTSRHMTQIDPVTGEPADNGGSAVSQGTTHGVSNVHFHPWLGQSPDRSCTENDAPLPPPPTPTATPWPTPIQGPAQGTGQGSGNGTGPGPGNGTGPGPGNGTRLGAGGQGTSTATALVRASATPSATPPPTATPEIVPGFGVGVGTVAIVVLVVAIAVRRRDVE